MCLVQYIVFFYLEITPNSRVFDELRYNCRRMTSRAININSRTWTGLIWTLKRLGALARVGSSQLRNWSCHLLGFYSNTILNFLLERANRCSSFWMRWSLLIRGLRLWSEKCCSPTVYFGSHDLTSFHPFLVFIRNFETVLITTNTVFAFAHVSLTLQALFYHTTKGAFLIGEFSIAQFSGNFSQIWGLIRKICDHFAAVVQVRPEWALYYCLTASIVYEQTMRRRLRRD